MPHDTMCPGLLRTVVRALALLAFEDVQGAETSITESPTIRYLGAWQTNAAGHYTIYPGSQVAFSLQGKGRVAFCSALPHSIRVAVRRAGVTVWDGVVDREEIALDGGTSSVPFAVVYLASAARGFDTNAPMSQGAEFTFIGVSSDKGGHFSPTQERRQEPVVEFIGDSITAGVVIHGRDGAWSNNSDASLTYAFLAADRLRLPYRIRGYPGSPCDGLARNYPWFRTGIPLPTNETPAIVVVNLGANDRPKSAADYQAGAGNLLKTIFATYPKTRVVLMNFCRMTPNRLPVLKTLSQSYPTGRVSLFDARRYLVGYSDEGVHPDVESHRRLADALSDYLLPMLQTNSANSTTR